MNVFCYNDRHFVGVACVLILAMASCDKPKPLQMKFARDVIEARGMVRSIATFDHTKRATRQLQKGTQEQRLAAIDDLVRLGTPQAVEELMAFIGTLGDGDFKEEAVRRASMIANRDAVPTFLGLITTTQDMGVLRVAQEVFARLAEAESLQTILDAYDSSTDPVVRERLVRSVGSVSNEMAAPVLMQVLSDLSLPASDGMIRSSAEALRQIGTAPAVDALIERINSDPSEESRSLLTAELGLVRNPLAEASLQTAAGGNSKFGETPDARTAAIWALVNYPSAETQERLQSLQADTNVQVSFAAAEALKAIERRFAAR